MQGTIDHDSFQKKSEQFSTVFQNKLIFNFSCIEEQFNAFFYRLPAFARYILYFKCETKLAE